MKDGLDGFPPQILLEEKGDEIHVLINGRPVAAQPFLQSIRRGYKTRLMQGRHPVAVLLLDLPNDEVDVNVHPTKREVRLKHSWRVLERLERSIAYTLESTPTEPESSGGITGITSLAPQPVERRVVEKPAWAQTAQISLTGEKPVEIKKEKPRPISQPESSQTTITGVEAIAPLFQSVKENYTGMLDVGKQKILTILNHSVR